MKKLPGYTFIDLGPDGGSFDQSNNPKVVVHTTEGSTLAGAEAAFKNYPPHLGYDPVRRIKHQYVSLDKSSYALRQSEAEDDYAIQVEVVGSANNTHKWSNVLYRNFADDVIVPLEKAIAVPRRHLRFYRAGEGGFVLASKYSPIRLRPVAWRAYSGWVGHQHSPGVGDNGRVLADGDEHWDPGGFLMDRAFAFVPGPQAKKEDVVNVLAKEKTRPEVWIGNFIDRRWVSQDELSHLEARFGRVQEWNDGTIGVLGIETAESKARRTSGGDV
jgi:hypothetical protein